MTYVIYFDRCYFFQIIMGTFAEHYHTRFLNQTSEELARERKARKEDCENVSTSSLCCSVISQTLQQLQDIKVSFAGSIIIPHGFCPSCLFSPELVRHLAATADPRSHSACCRLTGNFT